MKNTKSTPEYIDIFHIVHHWCKQHLPVDVWSSCIVMHAQVCHNKCIAGCSYLDDEVHSCINHLLAMPRVVVAVITALHNMQRMVADQLGILMRRGLRDCSILAAMNSEHLNRTWDCLGLPCHIQA